MRLLAVLSMGAVLAACAPVAQSAGVPWCDDFGVLVLEAQSAPHAQLVPCVDLMPLGWSAGESTIDDDGTSFTLHSSIAGRNAATVALEKSCDTAGFVQVPSDEPDTERFERVSKVVEGYEGTRIYTFEGGCVTVEFGFDVDVSAAHVNEVSLALGFMPREQINEAVRSVTEGREQVDPPDG